MANRIRNASPEQREAARQFMLGLWSDEQNRRLFRMTLESIWDRYKQTPKYERLRQALSDTAKQNGYHDVE